MKAFILANGSRCQEKAALFEALNSLIVLMFYIIQAHFNYYKILSLCLSAAWPYIPMYKYRGFSGGTDIISHAAMESALKCLVADDS